MIAIFSIINPSIILDLKPLPKDGLEIVQLGESFDLQLKTHFDDFISLAIDKTEEYTKELLEKRQREANIKKNMSYARSKK